MAGQLPSAASSPYIPRNGILLTQDPIGLAGGVNLYAYAGNNPVAFSDPWGLCPEPPCRVTDWSALHEHVIPKHVEGTRGPASRFVDTDEKALRHAIEATIERADFVSTEEVAGELRHTFERRWNGSIGSKGEQMMRVVISDAGELRTALPVRGPKAGATKVLGRGMSGALRRAGRVLGPVLGVVGIALELTLGATPAY